MNEVIPFMVFGLKPISSNLISTSANAFRVECIEVSRNTINANQNHRSDLTCVGDIPYADTYSTSEIGGLHLFVLISPRQPDNIANWFEWNALMTIFALYYRKDDP